jgi:hypothetical protein
VLGLTLEDGPGRRAGVRLVAGEAGVSVKGEDDQPLPEPEARALDLHEAVGAAARPASAAEEWRRFSLDLGALFALRHGAPAMPRLLLRLRATNPAPGFVDMDELTAEVRWEATTGTGARSHAEEPAWMRLLPDLSDAGPQPPSVEVVGGGRALLVRGAPGSTVMLLQGDAIFPARGVEGDPRLYAVGLPDVAAAAWPPQVRVPGNGETRVERLEPGDVHGVVQPVLVDDSGATLAAGEPISF